MTKKYKNLVFAGGGTKGVAYAGVLLHLYNLGYRCNDFERIGGTSIGALYAFVLTIGFEITEILDILLYKLPDEIKNIIDNISYTGTLVRLYKDKGIIEPSILYDLFYPYIVQKVNPDITFKELYEKTGKELVIVCTDINNLKITYFHHHKYPDVKVIDTVIASCSYPLAFTTTKLTINGIETEFSDGAIIENFAIEMFNNMAFYYSDDNIDLLDYDTNPETLGIAFNNYNSLNNNSNGLPSKNIIDFVFNKLIKSLEFQIERKRYTKNLENQTIFVELPSDVLSFDISNVTTTSRILDLIYYGRNAAKKFFDNDN